MAVDFHNHVIPGVDDGAQDVAESMEAIAQFREHGVTRIVATPHVDASLTRDGRALNARLAEIDEGWDAMIAAAAQSFPAVQLYRGVELALDVPDPDLSDARLRLNGGRFFLMEWPYMTVPPQSSRVIGSLRESGYVPIIAHPERYNGLQSARVAVEWRAAGALLQVNGASLLGRYGATPRRLATELLRLGAVDYICSDYHARGAPQTREYVAVLNEMGGAEQAHTLTETNPARMIEGLDPLPITAVVTRRTLWSRMTGRFN